MDDQPNTQAKPVGATIFVVPTRWRDTGPLTAELVVKLIETAVIDFYREDKTP